MKKDIFITITVCGLAILLVYMGGLDSADRKNILAQLSSSILLNKVEENDDQSNNKINARDTESSISGYSSNSENQKEENVLPVQNIEEEFKEKKDLLKQRGNDSYQDIKKNLLKKTSSIENDFKSEISDLSTTFNQKLKDAILRDVCKNVTTD